MAYYFSTMAVVDAFMFKETIALSMGREYQLSAFSHTHPGGVDSTQELFSRTDAKQVGRIGNRKYPPKSPSFIRTPEGDVRVLTPESSDGVKVQPGESVLSGDLGELPQHQGNR